MRQQGKRRGNRRRAHHGHGLGRHRRMLLSELPEHHEAVIEGYLNGETLVQRIMEMGLHRQEKIKILLRINNGPLLVKVHDAKIALDQGVAEKIVVRRLS